MPQIFLQKNKAASSYRGNGHICCCFLFEVFLSSFSMYWKKIWISKWTSAIRLTTKYCMHRVIFFTLVYLQMLSPRLKFSQTKFCLKRNNLRYCYSPLWQRGRKGRGVRIGQIFPCYQYGKMKSNWIFMFGLKIDSS